MIIFSFQGEDNDQKDNRLPGGFLLPRKQFLRSQDDEWYGNCNRNGVFRLGIDGRSFRHIQDFSLPGVKMKNSLDVQCPIEKGIIRASFVPEENDPIIQIAGDLLCEEYNPAEKVWPKKVYFEPHYPGKPGISVSQF